FLNAVAAEYDIVLVDTPPILPVTDSAIVAGRADGVLLVYQAGKVGRLVLKRAKTHLESARAHVWGVVLNDLQTEVSGYTYTHYYTHYYGEETPGEPPRGGAATVQRALDRARGWLGRGRANGATEDANGNGLSVATLALPDKGGASHRNRRSRHMLFVIIGLLGALGALAAGVAWRSGGLDVMNPRALVRQRATPSGPPSGRPTASSTPRPAPSSPANSASNSAVDPTPVVAATRAPAPAATATPA